MARILWDPMENGRVCETRYTRSQICIIIDSVEKILWFRIQNARYDQSKGSISSKIRRIKDQKLYISRNP